MDNKDVRKRDVMNFKEFAKAYEAAGKAIALKAGQNADPGAHAIQGEDLYVRNDANPYKAAGIPFDAKLANINQEKSYIRGNNDTEVYGPNKKPGKESEMELGYNHKEWVSGDPGRDSGETNLGVDKPTDPTNNKTNLANYNDARNVVKKLSHDTKK